VEEEQGNQEEEGPVEFLGEGQGEGQQRRKQGSESPKAALLPPDGGLYADPKEIALAQGQERQEGKGIPGEEGAGDDSEDEIIGGREEEKGDKERAPSEGKEQRSHPAAESGPEQQEKE